jgi:hypothetical protein
MQGLGRGAIMLVMTRPITSSKLLLVADNRPATPERITVPVRRYRLARLRLDGRSLDSALRFEHLKRVFD